MFLSDLTCLFVGVLVEFRVKQYVQYASLLTHCIINVWCDVMKFEKSVWVVSEVWEVTFCKQFLHCYVQIKLWH